VRLPGERERSISTAFSNSETDLAPSARKCGGRFVEVTASVSKLVPKAAHAVSVERHATREYFSGRDVSETQLPAQERSDKQHDVELSLLEAC